MLQLLPKGALSEQQADSTASYLEKLCTYLVQAPQASTSKGRNPRARSDTTNDILTLASLSLLGTMAEFSGGKYAAVISRHIPWGMRNLGRLSSARRRSNTAVPGAKKHKTNSGKHMEHYDMASITPARPDIRTYFILLVLTLLKASPSYRSSSSGNLAYKNELCSLSPSPIAAIFKGLAMDPSWVVSQVLQCLHEHLLSDEKLPRKTKLKVMGHLSNLEALVELYARNSEKVDVSTGLPLQANEEEQEEQEGMGITIAQMVHHFLLAVCTHPGFGIAFQDQGWYPPGFRQDIDGDQEEEGESVARNGDEDDADAGQHMRRNTRRTHNPILYSFLRVISPTRSALHVELVLRICQACPELIGAWLPNNSTPANAIAQMDSKGPSTGWIASVTLVTQLLSQPIPMIFQSVLSLPLPPPLPTLLANLLPSPPIQRSTFARALSGKHRLAQLSVLQLLAAALERVRALAMLCETAYEKFEVQAVQDEASKDGISSAPWTEVWREVRAAAQQLLPDLNVLSQFFVQLDSPPAAEVSANEQGNALLKEACLRCIWLTHDALFRPHAINRNVDTSVLSSSVRQIDLGKLLPQVFAQQKGDDTEAEPINSVSELHLLRTIAIACKLDTSQGVLGSSFDILARSSHGEETVHLSHFERILSLWRTTADAQIRSACTEILQVCVGQGPLFEFSQSEWPLWLWALQPNQQPSTKVGIVPEHFLETVSFIFDCAQRSSKLVHRYLESARELVSDTETIVISPLLMATVEQFCIRMEKKLFSKLASNYISLFMVRLFLGLSTTSTDEGVIQTLVAKCQAACTGTTVSWLFEEQLQTLLATLSSAKASPSKKANGRATAASHNGE